ncbi:MAG: 23S rRNA (uracil(1939)-C(5))-methyltransferase RlmD [Gammaproteobacteria bacterium]|nr:23S rRNA (uracil(1939)-C(5))-methyltransferase RlmD [Gammaproteobacteria bacterium]
MIDGRGVVDTEGKTVFVDGALNAERVRYRRRRKRKKFDEAELIELLEPSPHRVTPACTAYGVCGGCSLQHLAGEEQLRLKQKSLLDALSRIGGVAPAEIAEPLAGTPFGYRRRARMGARLVEKKGRVLVGFREKYKPYIADIEHCETLIAPLAALVDPLAELIAALQICRSVPQIELSYGDNLTSLVFRVLETPAESDLELFRHFEAAHNAQIWLQTGGPQTLRLLDGSATGPALNYRLEQFDLTLEYGPLDFVQVNQDMNRRMLDQAIAWLAPQPGEAILDLFCGIGNFTLPVARQGAHVTGIELDDAMVAKGRSNAELNDVSTAEFHKADLAAPEAQQAWWKTDYGAVLLDPPRAGALESLPLIARTGAPRILYVSCHPGSLARDAGILVNDYGYTLDKAGAMDMFPQTGHVEAMALFSKRNGS